MSYVQCIRLDFVSYICVCLYPEQSRNLGPAAVLRSESNYFDDDFRHHRSERDRRIDLQALQENFQAPEVVKWCIWCIVTR